MKVKGVGIWTMDNDRLADGRLNTIAFVFQANHLFRRLAIAENVAIPLILEQGDRDAWIAAANHYLDAFGLKDRGEILPLKLFGGKQLRVAIARTNLPNHVAMIAVWNLALAFGMIVVIAAISSWFGARRGLKFEPFDQFRG